jgi:SAM-dependent methyltransferase
MSHAELYRNARYYDVAFSYRDVPDEVDFFLACARRAGTEVGRALEMACGPGRHARELGRRGVPSVALDMQGAMVALCLDEARRSDIPVQGMVADMRTFALAEPVDLALTLLTSITYLLEPSDLRAHFASVYRALSPGGVYVVENNHPREFSEAERFKANAWTMSEDGVSVEVTWHANEPNVDWVRQRYEVESRFVVDDHGERVTITDRGWLRMMYPSELQGHGEAAGFVLCDLFGAADVEQPLDFSEAAWRTFAVFQKPRG